LRITLEKQEPAEDESQLRRALAGEAIALDRLLSPHQQTLYSLCRNMLGHAEDAEDAVQETYLRAIRALPRFRQDADVYSWLFRIAVNVCLNWKRARGRTVPLEMASERASAEASPEDATLARFELDRALAILSRRQRAVLLLREREGWSVPEIAETLKCSHRRINNELYQTRRALEAWMLAHTEKGQPT
jgi:RNA polymerase sigma-70 factor, ECF subfamily